MDRNRHGWSDRRHRCQLASVLRSQSFTPDGNSELQTFYLDRSLSATHKSGMFSHATRPLLAQFWS